jgi:AhpD family alkylhydroperoxidase
MVGAMTTFPVHTIESAPDDAVDVLKAVEGRVGFLPHLAGAMAGSPVLITAFADMQPTLGRATLTGLEREVVAITLSHANTADYPLAAHGRFAVKQGGSPDLVEAACAGGTLPDPRLDALATFTRVMIRTHGHVPTPAFDAFLAAGFTAEQALEVVAQLGYTTMANLAANLAQPPIDEAFRAG